MALRKLRSGLTLIELAILVTIAGVVVGVVWMLVNAHKRKDAVVTFKTNVASIRGIATMCASEASGMLQSGVSGNSVCVDGAGVYPNVPAGCGAAPVFYFIDARSESWKLTTTTDAKGRTNWDCHGCRPICQASGCTFVETNPGDCY